MSLRIDAPPPGVYHFRLMMSPLGSALALALALAGVAACAHRAPPASPTPQGSPAAPGESAAPASPGAATNAAPPASAPAAAGDTAAADVARAAIAATAPKRPMKLVFAWSLQDRDARFSGKGAARIEPPYRARLDLFGPRDEGYLSAAVVGEDLRIPPAAQAQAAVVPPPALLWTALGVLNPPADARLTTARRDGDQTELDYTRGPERWRFTLLAGRLSRVQFDRSGAGRLTVELKGTGPEGLPKQAVYRDYAAFRTLTLTLDRADEAEPFPPAIWSPGGR